MESLQLLEKEEQPAELVVELAQAAGSLALAGLEARQAQVANLTANVKVPRLPYFVR